MRPHPLVLALASLSPLFFSHLAWGADVAINTVADFSQLSGTVAPGTVFVIADGTYALPGNVPCTASATEAAPIVVRAKNKGGAKISFGSGTVEGFKVTGANWHFDGLDVHGTCATDTACEHAFHVMGGAVGFVLQNSKIYDFNAELKVNAVGGTIPHRGRIEGNDIGDTRGRSTSNPVTKLNIDTGDDWVVRGNVIHDFWKDGGDTVSYGVFLKSGGNRGLIEGNLILCARDVPTGGARIGASFGGGGTGPQYCAPAFDANVPCDIEHTDGTIQNNIIANCSDVGIYLNKSKQSHILSNTLIGTSGVDFRFSTTTGEARGNLMAGGIHPRNGGTFTDGGNKAVDAAFFASSYTAPLLGDLRLKAGSPAGVSDMAPAPAPNADYCGRLRSDGKPDFGALESSLGDCATLGGGHGGGSTSADAGVSDGGGATDGGTHDAAVSTDGGQVADGGSSAATTGESGCSCNEAQSHDRGAPALFGALLAVCVGALRGRKGPRG